MSLQQQVACIFASVFEEVQASEAKHGDQMHFPLGFSDEDFGESAAHYTRLTNQAAREERCTWMHIAREEVFETFAEDDLEKARKEAIQAAAMFVQIIRKIDLERGPVAKGDRVLSPDYGWGTVSTSGPAGVVVEWDHRFRGNNDRKLLVDRDWVNGLERGEAEAL